MKKIITSITAVFVSLFTPVVSWAQSVYKTGTYVFPTQGTFADVIFWALDWMNVAVKGIIALAVIVFLWGVTQSIMKGDDEKARTEGRNFMIYGIIGLAVMLSLWGLVAFVQRSFGLETMIPQFTETNNQKTNSFKTIKPNITVDEAFEDRMKEIDPAVSGDGDRPLNPTTPEPDPGFDMDKDIDETIKNL